MKKIEKLDEIKMEGFVLLDFSALWCKPCQWMLDYVIKPKVEQMYAMPIYLVDVDDFPDVSYRHYKVPAVPTFILLKDGVEVDRVLGAREELLMQMLKEKVISDSDGR